MGGEVTKFKRYQAPNIPSGADIEAAIDGIRTQSSIFARWGLNTDDDNELDRLGDNLWWAEAIAISQHTRRMVGWGGGHTELEACAGAYISAVLTAEGEDPGAWWCDWPDEDRLRAIPREVPPGLVFVITASPEPSKLN